MNTLPISNNPEEVKSHYEKLSVPDKRGQARYRCKKCGYELECTGRGRLIVHIVGQLLSGTPQKQVRFCPNPDERLKAALMSFIKTDKFHSRTKFRTKKCVSKESALAPCGSKEPATQFSPAGGSADSCSSHSESVLGKRSAESFPSEQPKTFQSTSQYLDPDNSFGEMKKGDLLHLLNILRLMDPDKFELALSIKGFSSRQSVEPVVSSHSDSSLLLENSIRLLQQYQQLLQLLQLQNVLCSLGSSGTMHTNPSSLNSVVTPSSTLGSSFLFYPQLLGQVNHESVNTSPIQGNNFPAAAFQHFPERK